MKKKIVLMIAVALAVTLLTGTVAYAAGGNGPADTQGAAQSRSQYMEQIREQVQAVLNNSAEIDTLRAQLIELREQTRTHLEEMYNNPDSVTDAQIEAAKTISAQIQTARQQLAATNNDMRQYRLQLRSARRTRDYEGIIAAYDNVLRIQEQRITLLQQLVQLHEQACAL